jgi:hypothetical protein
VLVDLFWCDLERHHPDISSLHLPDQVVQGWKRRIRVLPNGKPRRTVHTVLLAVRAFYLDLLQWSLEDPARWARWAAPAWWSPQPLPARTEVSRRLARRRRR